MTESPSARTTLSEAQVRDIAELARLELSDDELRRYASQLTQILGYFDMLSEVDTTGVSPTASVLPLRSVMREDAAGAPLTPEQAVANAPDAEYNQFRVMPVMGDES